MPIWLYRDFDSNQPIPPDQGDGVVTFHRVSPGGGLRYDYAASVLDLRQVLTVASTCRARTTRAACRTRRSATR